MERKQTKMIEMQPRMVSLHMKVKKQHSKEEEEEGRCFLSVLLFNSRNNGRFPFQLIILLVSCLHCTRTGRDHLIVGIVLKYTWCSGMCCQKQCGSPLTRDTTPD